MRTGDNPASSQHLQRRSSAVWSSEACRQRPEWPARRLSPRRHEAAAHLSSLIPFRGGNCIQSPLSAPPYKRLAPEYVTVGRRRAAPPLRKFRHCAPTYLPHAQFLQIYSTQLEAGRGVSLFFGNSRIQPVCQRSQNRGKGGATAVAVIVALQTTHRGFGRSTFCSQHTLRKPQCLQ